MNSFKHHKVQQQPNTCENVGVVVPTTFYECNTDRNIRNRKDIKDIYVQGGAKWACSEGKLLLLLLFGCCWLSLFQFNLTIICAVCDIWLILEYSYTNSRDVRGKLIYLLECLFLFEIFIFIRMSSYSCDDIGASADNREG